ncbi:MAG: transaldolase [Petroclostridium sp.]|jgi:transaldolase|uniref:transaldolase family protein n=1 Tax=Petroclostridium xylanilyticum TaxID=1792311 RepID=UPI000B993A68|nr:transaldolase family protein [Petroclostridium xylanilyticum]MBZ4644514.1 Transaldolase [Clostridia bacterium]MDK2809987.1 transaldolase [Petroclostridium sp.]
MSEKQYKSPLHEMASTTPTDFWNDSCSISELQYALEYGAVGATTNPVIVGEVLKKEMHLYKDRIKELIQEMPTATEDDIAWKLNEEMAVAGAKLLYPIYEQTKGQKGRISIQTNTKYYRNAELMTKQAVHFGNLAPNIQVKMPTTKAGIQAFEEATYHGVSINATVCFTVPQALAVAEAVERGLKRREQEGKDTSWMHPVCTIMVGRLDDWLKVVADRDGIIVDPECLEWAGVAAMKNAYRIYKERGYRTQLLAAAYRNHHQWSEFIGADMSLTIPHKWIKRFNHSDITVENRIDKPVDPKIIEQLTKHFPDFNKAYQPDGMTVEEFDTYGALSRTLLQFLAGYDELVRMIRDVMITVK